jgi:nucleotide-binding universal stress UspA family protein
MVIRRILCPIDFSEFSTRAYRHALSVAEHYTSRLIALHIVELWKYPYADYGASEGDYANVSRVLHEGGEIQLEKFIGNHPHETIRPELKVEQGVAADRILATARELDASLVIMGTHGHRGVDRLMFGTTTDRVMRRSACPVLAVCQYPQTDDDPKHAHTPHHVYRVLYCTDFSESSAAALAWAVSVAEEYSAELTLLHVIEDESDSAKVEKFTLEAKDRLQSLIAEPPANIRIKIMVRSGKTYREIIQHSAEAQIDLVAMGVRGRGAVDLAVFGSTTYRVIQLGCCPVLVVHI